MFEASTELAARGSLIGTLEGQIQELQDTVGDRGATIDFLGDQLHDLQLDLDDAQEQLHQQQHAQAMLHAPPDEMQVDDEEEPHEIEGVSYLDHEEEAPQPAQMEPYSPVASESSVNNLDDF
jgi:hypothetical protein